jgi:Xaa-Pro aminopeptidase
MSQTMSLTHEYPERIRRAQTLMANQGLDALLLLTGANLTYFTGLPFSRSGSRPFFGIVPRSGNLVLIVQDGRIYETKTYCPDAEVRTYAQLSHVPLAEIDHALTDLRLKSSRIGAAMSREMVLDLPIGAFFALRDSQPNVEFVDASPLLWELRLVKSAAEIACIERACAITLAAFDQTFAAVKPGLTEAAVEHLMIYNLLRGGGSSPWVLITSGAGNYDLVSKGGTDRAIEPGDMIWMDCGCSVNGYFSDFGRAVVVGGASVEQTEAQQLIHRITGECIDLMSPGVSVAEIATYGNEAVRALALPVTSNISGLAARIGHGLGLATTELPSLSETDATRLQPGMVITIEPGVATEYGTFHVEENVLITETEPRILSGDHWQLWESPA